MTAQVSIDLRPYGRQDDVTSPELVLVDPDLGALARERLPDAPPVRLEWTPIAQHSAVVRTRVEPAGPLARRVPRLDERRLLVGCALVTALVVLLVDLRVGAGNSPATQATPVSTAALPGSVPRPSKTPAKPTDRRFVWAATPKASGYHVEFFRASRRVFVRDTTEPEVVVPARWTYAGGHRTLRPGEYTWYVWPVVRGRRATSATVQATVSIPG
jgi:hypothetical protein